MSTTRPPGEPEVLGSEPASMGKFITDNPDLVDELDRIVRFAQNDPDQLLRFARSVAGATNPGFALKFITKGVYDNSITKQTDVGTQPLPPEEEMATRAQTASQQAEKLLLSELFGRHMQSAPAAAEAIGVPDNVDLLLELLKVTREMHPNNSEKLLDIAERIARLTGPEQALRLIAEKAFDSQYVTSATAISGLLTPRADVVTAEAKAEVARVNDLLRENLFASHVTANPPSETMISHQAKIRVDGVLNN